MDLTDLVCKSKKGDKEALIQLVMLRKSEYYKLAYVYMGNKEDSLDVMQDMIVILYENIKKLKHAELFYSWSKKILVNCCKNALRKRKKLTSICKFEKTEIVENYLVKEQRIDILRYLKKLNKYQQEAIKLKYFFDMDYETISYITDAPLGTVKSRIFTGLKKLREAFGGEY